MSLDVAQAEAGVGAQVIAPSLQNNQKMYKHGNLQFTTLQNNNFGVANNLSGSLTQSIINIGPDVVNFSKSYLNFKVTLPAPGAGNFLYTMEDVLSEIQHIQLYPSTANQFIVDVDNVGQYWKGVLKQEISLAEYQTYDRMNKLYPSNSLKNVIPALRSGTIAGALGALPIESSMNYTEPTYFAVGTNNGAVTYDLYVPLAMFKNTYFAIDQLVYFSQTIFMRVYWNQLNKIAFATNSGNAPNAGVDQNYAGAGSITNVNLYLATEQVPAIRQEIMAKCQAGFSMLIPVIQNFVASSSGPKQSITSQLDIGMGKILQKMYWIVQNQIQNGLLSYDISNNNGSKVQQYYTMLNNQREQQITLDCTAAGGYTDYIQQKERLKGSICQNHDVFQYNWAHCSDYTGFTAEYTQGDNTSLISGVPMSGIPLTWTFYGTQMGPTIVGAPYAHYGFGVFIKELKISATEVTVN